MRSSTRVVPTAALLRDRFAGILPSAAPVEPRAAQCGRSSSLSRTGRARTLPMAPAVSWRSNQRPLPDERMVVVGPKNVAANHELHMVGDTTPRAPRALLQRHHGASRRLVLGGLATAASMHRANPLMERRTDHESCNPVFGRCSQAIGWRVCLACKRRDERPVPARQARGLAGSVMVTVPSLGEVSGSRESAH
jgi:hypothetical protein